MSKTIFLETHNLKNKAGGLGTFNYELIKGLSQHELGGLQLTLNVIRPSDLESEFGSKFSYHKYSSLSRHKVFRIRKTYDLWHSVNQNTKVEPHRTTNYLLTVHDVNFMEETSEGDPQKLSRLFREKLNRATAISYISNYAREQTHRHFTVPAVPEHIIYNGNPISTRRDITAFITNVPVSKPFLYSIGDFLERKNFMALIAMMPLLPQYNLILSGNYDKPYGEKIRNAITEMNLGSQVFLTGKVDDTAKQFYLANCEAFVFPSLREGFGLPPIEAMAFAKPVFLSNRASLPEIGGDAAYYWNDFEPGAMRDVLLSGIEDFGNDARRREKVLERAAKFDWKDSAGQYLKLYRSMLD